MTQDDARWMRHALSLGARGAGQVWPNPAVGCVIVKHGRVVGRGWTAPGGRPHAEPQALDQAGDEAVGATAYVTLEPCAHWGQTPPCADALIRASVARVVVGLRDPDPRTDGGGIDRLREAGVAVTGPVLEEEARRAHRGFLSRVLRGRPRLTLKLASSFDGRIATATGESQWITGPDARRAVHAMRMRHDAVMVGAGTARADDPSLTVRGMGALRQPVRVVISRRLDLPLDGVLARSAREVPVWVICGDSADADLRAAWEGLGARVLTVATGPGGQIDPTAALEALGREGLTSVFCEGGGALAASLLSADLVDDLVGFTAGMVIGAEGQPGIGAMGLADLAEAPRFKLRTTSRIGADILHEWTRPLSSW
ncbi:bifunctional diaminohydroxyphosphoribosylaminopyrimidine deaminase/5-amino-6-(5-phosphoribosylamino)uracil reductase RibD [Nioella sediminis]|jgi:diaminohydroxyphosphoribosylaminopyrimidine deaminase/5-amino-6-(5-phosphoribosylamino)uracil reductase|uniref:bifunctional diaminohydroxyphosphoribosylaminopyrimidine deaminase/5-amino-6-(5-phosphoribosylamino)uracil reductase RibD n=1 Tax=Nioella sediminis TaxID=1912092 RepID=UPI0008FD7073|nr:bifunctional diaminohydroxyphosphoribosylaminopyrimidine deaminase/5-amino-6-(5-phosphoribosylamino)uracil reductase RibD [Nioella sediminis]TBX21006.1 5-amino-6-(5-phosphoribosylamino)uracil reductase [Roseovarius sp. JS7-11]